MKLSRLTLSSIAILALANMSFGAAISITIDTGSKSLKDENGVPLSGGSPTVERDGVQAVLGYFSDAATGNIFGTAGNFVPLTGPNSPFLFNFTVGDTVDNGAGNGEMFLNALTFNTGVADAILPAPGTPLVLRFFNRVNSASASFVLDISNALWAWKLPATPAATLSINLDDPGLVRRGAASNNDRTSVQITDAANQLRTSTAVVAVPEPSSVMLALFGGAVFFARRRR